MTDSRCGKRGPLTGGQCSKYWGNEHEEHHSLETGERWKNEDADRIREHRKEARKVLVNAVWDLVIADMKTRDRIGFQSYGRRLTGATEIDPLTYAYEEALDLACYLRKILYERDGK